MRESAKQSAFRLLNILFPLFLGSAVYIFMTDETYISQWFRWMHSGGADANNYLTSPVMRFVRNYLCDMCWAYSMVFCVTWILDEIPCGAFVGVVVCALFSVLMEILQLTECVPGTFDLWDIILEICSCMIAGMIIYTEIWRKRK